MTRFEPAWKNKGDNKVLYEILKGFDLFSFVPVLSLYRAVTLVWLALLWSKGGG